MRPYLIVCPNFDDTSVGNITLFDLCHRLNKKGQTAYITAKIGNPKWINPSITDEEVQKRTDWIVVYPDTVLGNPCGATRVVRWFMNKPEFYWEIMKWDFYKLPDNGEFTFTYHRAFDKKSPVLHLREIDETIFYKGKEKRKGIIYYVGKAINRNVRIPKFIKDKGIEIKTGKDLFPKTKKELADMLRKAERLYLFVGSALHEEALYCGCPVIFLGDKRVDALADDFETMTIDNIKKRISKGDTQVDEFIKITQQEVKRPKTVVLDFDDFSLENNNLFYLFKLKKLLPNLKVSMFMIPFDYQYYPSFTDFQRDEILKQIKANLDWIEIIPHGLTHKHREFENVKEEDYPIIFRAIDDVFKKYGIPYVKGFKAPFWLYNKSLVKYLDKKGWFLAVDRNQPKSPRTKKYYEYNHSIDEKFWLFTDEYKWKLHGHVSGPSENNIIDNIINLTKIPTDATFKFVSEMLSIK